MNLLSARMLDLFLPHYPLVQAAERERILADTAAFLWSEVHRSPAHVRAGVLVLGLAFRLWMALAQARLQGPAAIERWEALTGGPGRAFVRLVRSIATLSYLEHPLVLPYLGMPQVPEQQTRFRQTRRRSMHSDAP